jgi:transcription elongation GreA/GreB family factor
MENAMSDERTMKQRFEEGLRELINLCLDGGRRAEIERLTREREEYKARWEAAAAAAVRRQGALDCMTAENERLRRGLQLVQEAGPIHGGAWCAAQAKGHLEDLDFDEWPETGKPRVNVSFERSP